MLIYSIHPDDQDLYDEPDHDQAPPPEIEAKVYPVPSPVVIDDPTCPF